MKEQLKNVLRPLGLLPAAKLINRNLREALFRFHYNRARQKFLDAANGLPIPPPELNFLVTGGRDVPWYVESGQRGARCIRDILAKNDIFMEDFAALLDFGCGSGRVIRYWNTLPGEVHGSDYNPRLARWCRKHLPFARFGVNQLEPPLDYADGSFDFVYALSIFTHFDERRQFAWMTELARVIKPGGYLFFTTQGSPYYFYLLTEAQKSAFQRGEMVMVKEELAGHNACCAYHPAEWVKEELLSGWKLLDYVPEGAMGNPPQDVFLVQKPG